MPVVQKVASWWSALKAKVKATIGGVAVVAGGATLILVYSPTHEGQVGIVNPLNPSDTVWADSANYEKLRDSLANYKVATSRVVEAHWAKDTTRDTSGVVTKIDSIWVPTYKVMGRTRLNLTTPLKAGDKVVVSATVNGKWAGELHYTQEIAADSGQEVRALMKLETAEMTAFPDTTGGK